MAISLSKGGNINLSKEVPGLSKITLGLGWKPRVTAGADFDLDASAFMISESGKVRSDADFIFYKQKESVCKSVIHNGDNRTGAGDGDDESIKVDLSKVPADVQKIVFTVTIYEWKERGQNFGQVQDAYIRITNDAGGAEIARYDLSEDASTVTAMMFAELYRNNGEWKFKAVGQGFSGGLGELARNFGVDIS
jgi:tellurium resistance protein TerD